MGRGVMASRRRGAFYASYRAQLGPQMGDQAPVPVWVRRMHADGLPTTRVRLREPLRAGSQRFIDRWNRVASGY